MNSPIAETQTSKSEGTAARAKNASSVAFQIRVARVSKPVGPRMRVAGSSFMQLRNTSATAVNTPGRASGKMMEVKTSRGV